MSAWWVDGWKCGYLDYKTDDCMWSAMQMFMHTHQQMCVVRPKCTVRCSEIKFISHEVT